MKFFSKEELIALFAIFLVLIGVSWPNFSLSLRRARDQTRRDDMSSIQTAIGAYYSDYGIYPASTPDGRIVVCKGPNTKGNDIELIPCTWGKDAWVNLTPGVNKTYLRILPNDPNSGKGMHYVYYSDGSRYQLMASLESPDESGYDKKLADRGVSCGYRVCNIGRVDNVPLYISIEEYNFQVYCAGHPKDAKCINTKK